MFDLLADAVRSTDGVLPVCALKIISIIKYHMCEKKMIPSPPKFA